MGARLRSWWQQIKQHRVTILVVASILAVAIALIIAGYRFDWTGFNGNNKSGKTLWDWLQLLIIPAVLAVGGYLFNYTTSRNEQKANEQRVQIEREAAAKRDQTERGIALDNQREAALQAYLDNMSELLLEKHLRESQPEDEVRKIARVRTLTVLRRLDGLRKGSVLQFLHESGLIDKGKRIIDLRGAHLEGASLEHADLRGADLRAAYLYEANLIFADLRGADLRAASLEHADLIEANLEHADLAGAYLFEAHLAGSITPEQLATAKEYEELWYP